MRCLVCKKAITTAGRLLDHAVRSHGVNAAKLRRIIDQHSGQNLWLVRTRDDGYFIVVEEPLL